VVEEGAGQPNDAPLWPLHAGTNVDRTRILGERDIDGQRLWVVVQEGAPSVLSWAPPTYYSESADGVLFHGNLTDGLWSRPLLVVPKTVRPGMTWTSDPGGKGPSGGGRPFRCTASTLNVDVSTSFLQVPRVWQIDCRDGYLGAWAHAFVEGVGLAPLKRMDVRSGPDPDVPPMPAPSTLEPLNGGRPIVEKFFAHRVGALEVPGDGAGKRRIVAYGEVAIFLLQGVVNPDGSGFGTNAWVPTKTHACLMLDGKAPVESTLDADTDCPDPLGAAVGGDGTLRFIPPGRYCLENGDACSNWNFFGIRGDADGAEVLVTSDQLYSARYYDGTEEHPWYRVENAERSGLKLGNLGRLDAIGYWQLFGEKGAPGESLMVPDDLGAHWYAGSWDGRWHDAHPALAPAALAASVTPEARDVLDVTADGEISRLAIADGNVTLSLLAKVTPPSGHAVVGAVDVGGELLVFTQGDYRGWSPQVTAARVGSDTPPEVDPQIEPLIGNVYAWSTTPETAPGDPAPPPPERTPVYLQAETRDLRVCAPAGWPDPGADSILGDTPAERAVPVSKHCALFVRDTDGPSPVMPNGWQWLHPFLFEGDVPGAGHVRAAVRSPNADATWPSISSAAGELAPLTGGGFVNGTQPLLVWSAGGVLEGPADGAEGAAALADGNGNGLWMRNPETVDCPVASGCVSYTLWGRTREVFTFDDEPPSSPLRQGGGTTGVVGGGILTPHYLLRPDGTRHSFEPPIAALGATFTVWGAFADDTVCGDYVENIVTDQGASGIEGSLMCIDRDGAVRTAPNPGVTGLPTYATADGVLYGADEVGGGVLRFDPEALTLTVLDKTSLTGVPANATSPVNGFVRDASGELYAMYRIQPPPTAQSLPIVLHLTRNGAEQVAFTTTTVPDLLFSADRLLVDDDTFIFLGPVGSDTGAYRLPRN
jgi:hypothetical protein